jgi:hypothetical protein
MAMQHMMPDRPNRSIEATQSATSNMYKIEYLNCPYGTRCAPPTLHKLFSPLLMSLGPSVDIFNHALGEVLRDFGKEHINMMQRMFEHAGYIAIGAVVYVNTSPSFVSALLMAHR